MRLPAEIFTILLPFPDENSTIELAGMERRSSKTKS
jgi:hypothetical protein